MAFNDLRSQVKTVKDVRDNTTNKNLAQIVVARVTTFVLSLKPSQGLITPSGQPTMYGTAPTIIDPNLISL